MSSGRRQAIEREARRLRSELQYKRATTFSTSDTTFQRDVITRLRQLLAGDETPIEENADD